MSEKPLDTEKEDIANETEEMETIIEQELVDDAGSEVEEGVQHEGDDATSENEQEDALERLAQLEEQLQEAGNRYLRLQADYDNFRRRTREEKSQERKLRAHDLVSDLLPVLDNFKRALDIETTSDETATLKQGMEMVFRQLRDALQKEGVEELQALNQSFDPNLHQAVMQEAIEGVDPNTVVDVFQAGYSLNGKIIRPAMVKVSAD